MALEIPMRGSRDDASDCGRVAASGRGGVVGRLVGEAELVGARNRKRGSEANAGVNGYEGILSGVRSQDSLGPPFWSDSLIFARIVSATFWQVRSSSTTASHNDQ